MLSTAMIVSMAPVVVYGANQSTEPSSNKSADEVPLGVTPSGETSQGGEAQKPQEYQETLGEAFPSDSFRNAIRHSLQVSRTKGSDDKYDTLTDKTTIEDDVKADLSQTTYLMLNMEKDKHEPEGTELRISEKDLQSLVKYFPNLQSLAIMGDNVHVGINDFLDMLASYPNLVEGQFILTTEEQKLGNTLVPNEVVLPNMNKLLLFGIMDFQCKKVDIKNAPNLKSVTIISDVSEVDLGNVSADTLYFDGLEINSLDLSKCDHINNLTIRDTNLLKVDVNTLDATGLSADISNNGRIVKVSDENPTFDASGYGIEDKKVAEVFNGKYKPGGEFTINDLNKPLYYKYDCTNKHRCTFYLLPISIKTLKVEEGTTPSNNEITDGITNKAIFEYIYNMNLRPRVYGNPGNFDSSLVNYDISYKNLDFSKVGNKGKIKVGVNYNLNGVIKPLTEVEIPYEVVAYQPPKDTQTGNTDTGNSGTTTGNSGTTTGNTGTTTGTTTGGSVSTGSTTHTSINGWHKDKNGKWTYAENTYSIAKDKVLTIGGHTYSFDKNGTMQTGWVKKGDSWYYFNKKGQGIEGAMVAGTWKKIGKDWYYFEKDGKMAADETIGNYYVNKSGAYRYSHWIKNGNGKWWYYYKEGGYPANEITTINGNKYHFDSEGWMTTGWLYDNGSWYYFNQKGNGTEGAMAHNQWKKVNGKWYYFYEDGRMASNTWEKVNGKWYYFYKSGAMAANTVVNGYRVNSQGAWVK